MGLNTVIASNSNTHKHHKRKLPRSKLSEEERKEKKREKARLRQRKCREKKKREAIDRQFPAKRALPQPIHAIFPCKQPSSTDLGSHNNTTQNFERSTPLHDTDQKSQLVVELPSSPPPSNSGQFDVDIRTTRIPNDSPLPSISQHLFPKQQHRFNTVTPISSSHDFGGAEFQDRGCPSEVYTEDDYCSSDSKVHRVTPVPSMRACFRPNDEYCNTGSKEGSHHPIFAVDALLSIGMGPSIYHPTGNTIIDSGGYRSRPPPPQIPPLSGHESSNVYFSSMDCGDNTNKVRLLSPCRSNEYYSYIINSQYPSY